MVVEVELTVVDDVTEEALCSGLPVCKGGGKESVDDIVGKEEEQCDGTQKLYRH